MRILALQLKRIGDLVLTTPALAALKRAHPSSELVLAVHSSTAGLLPAIGDIDSTIVFGPKRGWTPWQQTLTGGFDAVLDFTGTDRSALATFFARAQRRITFEWVRKKRVRSLVYGEFVNSSVRERHTVDHYLDLARPLGIPADAATSPALNLPSVPCLDAPFAVLHPGTARPEKHWVNQRWAEVAKHLHSVHGMKVVVTTGPDPVEREGAETIRDAAGAIPIEVTQPASLCDFAALLAGAAVVVSCDTAAVHLAAAFGRPQVALFGPTNPYHWRPRHRRASVISAANPDAPLTAFDPRQKGAPMERISTPVVCRAIDEVLACSTSPLLPTT